MYEIAEGSTCADLAFAGEGIAPRSLKVSAFFSKTFEGNFLHIAADLIWVAILIQINF